MHIKKLPVSIFLMLSSFCKTISAQDTFLYKVVSVDSIEMPELNFIITLEKDGNLYKVISPKDTIVMPESKEIIRNNDFLFLKLEITNKIKTSGNTYLYIYNNGFLYLGREILEKGEYPYWSNQIAGNYYIFIN